MKNMNEMPMHGKMASKEQMEKMCPDHEAPSLEMEDPINGKDPKSIEISMMGPCWE